MCRCSLTHIDYFYIIMCMRRKMYKTGMRSDLDQLALLQKLRTVHNHFLLFCIKLWIDLLFSFKNPTFLICDHRQFPDQFLMHLLPAFLVYPFIVQVQVVSDLSHLMSIIMQLQSLSLIPCTLSHFCCSSYMRSPVHYCPATTQFHCPRGCKCQILSHHPVLSESLMSV